MVPRPRRRGFRRSRGSTKALRVQDRVAQAMRALRHTRGALTLQTPEAQAVFDADELSDLRSETSNRAKQLIEDFMIAANTANVTYLATKGFPTLRRVLRAPERWDRIVALADGLGDRLPPTPSGEALATFLAKHRRESPDSFQDLSLSIVKLLGRGEYVLEVPGQQSEGHFGLAVTDYTHSTAPNRRFPDLATQRLLKAAIAGERPPYSHDELDALARHCTDQEANAAKVERRVLKSAAAQLPPGVSHRPVVRRPRDGRLRQGDLGPHRAPRGGRESGARGFEGLDVGDRA